MTGHKPSSFTSKELLYLYNKGVDRLKHTDFHRRCELDGMIAKFKRNRLAELIKDMKTELLSRGVPLP